MKATTEFFVSRTSGLSSSCRACDRSFRKPYLQTPAGKAKMKAYQQKIAEQKETL